jgi:hypothetical protein
MAPVSTTRGVWSLPTLGLADTLLNILSQQVDTKTIKQIHNHILLVITPSELSSDIFYLHESKFIYPFIKQISPMLINIPSVLLTTFSNEIEVSSN